MTTTIDRVHSALAAQRRVSSRRPGPAWTPSHRRRASIVSEGIVAGYIHDLSDRHRREATEPGVGRLGLGRPRAAELELDAA